MAAFHQKRLWGSYPCAHTVKFRPVMQGWAQGQSSDLSLFHPFGAPQAELCPPRGPSPCQTGCSFPDYSENCSDHSGNLKSPIPVIQTAFIPFLRDLEDYSEKWVTSQKTINESESDPVQRTAKNSEPREAFPSGCLYPILAPAPAARSDIGLVVSTVCPALLISASTSIQSTSVHWRYKRLKRKQIIN